MVNIFLYRWLVHLGTWQNGHVHMYICICSCVCSAVCSCNSFDRRQCDRPHEERHRILDGNTLAELKQQNRNTQRSQVAQKNMSCGSSPSCAFANYARVTQTSSFVIIVLRYLSKIHAHKHTHTTNLHGTHFSSTFTLHSAKVFPKSYRINLCLAFHLRNSTLSTLDQWLWYFIGWKRTTKTSKKKRILLINFSFLYHFRVPEILTGKTTTITETKHMAATTFWIIVKYACNWCVLHENNEVHWSSTVLVILPRYKLSRPAWQQFSLDCPNFSISFCPLPVLCFSFLFYRNSLR